MTLYFLDICDLLSYAVVMFDASLNFTLIGDLVFVLIYAWDCMRMKLGVRASESRGGW